MKRFAVGALLMIAVIAGTWFFVTRRQPPAEEAGPVFAPMPIRVVDAASLKPLPRVKLYGARLGTNSFYVTDSQGTATVMACTEDGLPSGDFDVFAKGYEKQCFRICSNNPTVLLRRSGS
jgi:hypothetical protein